mmetsp:Transcript_14319/g.21643  ORF Transcript_14319/g.21643 Transcript_14319/m.21643 type:complete len:215 (+) Transcript_14319:23-667(+)
MAGKKLNELQDLQNQLDDVTKYERQSRLQRLTGRGKGGLAGGNRNCFFVGVGILIVFGIISCIFSALNFFGVTFRLYEKDYTAGGGGPNSTLEKNQNILKWVTFGAGLSEMVMVIVFIVILLFCHFKGKVGAVICMIASIIYFIYLVVVNGIRCADRSLHLYYYKKEPLSWILLGVNGGYWLFELLFGLAVFLISLIHFLRVRRSKGYQRSNSI